MLSKNQQKLIRQLAQKKYRQQLGLFVAEGEKLVYELLQAGWKAQSVFTTVPFDPWEYTMVNPEQLNRATHLATASTVLGVFHLPEYPFDEPDLEAFSLVLDGIADPGNLGTIIRLCDWYGIRNIYCSSNTVDCFNPKVVQSTMGSIARVKCHYTDLEALVGRVRLPVFAAVLSGESHYKVPFPHAGLLVLGSESHGIRPELLQKNTNKITIKPRAQGEAHAESLNVATASAILLSEIFRG